MSADSIHSNQPQKPQGPRLSVIIVAAGASTRFGMDKQMALLDGLPLFLHSVRRFLPMAARMVVAVPEARLAEFQDTAKRHGVQDARLVFIPGGDTRTQSVRNALETLTEDALTPVEGIVAIHDAARPLATEELLQQLVEAASRYGGAAPGTPVTDTLLKATQDGIMEGTQPRQSLWHVATPQVFQLKPLLEAYDAIPDSGSFTDDTQVFFNHGGTVKVIQETTENLKITYPGDLFRAETLLRQRKRLFLAAPLGYCNGVRQAIAKFNALHEKYPAETIHVLNELVHNHVISRQMTAHNARFVKDISLIPDLALTLFGTHGVTKDAEMEAQRRHLAVTDAICPLVAQLQKTVAEASPDLPLVFFGDPLHHEVISILDHAAARQVFVVQSIEDLDALPPLDRALFLSQTTRNAPDVARMADALKAKIPRLDNRAHICDAVRRRQAAMAALATACDLAIVVSSPHSSNGRRLAEVARRQGVRTLMLETADELDQAALERSETIVLGAATSTPDDVIQAVVAKLNALGYMTQPGFDAHVQCP